jgi:hypothetical protein
MSKKQVIKLSQADRIKLIDDANRRHINGEISQEEMDDIVHQFVTGRRVIANGTESSHTRNRVG